MSHSEQVGRNCVKLAESRWGRAWKLLSDCQQRGAVCDEISSVILSSAALDISDAHRKSMAFDHITAVTRTALTTLNKQQGKE